MKRLAVLLGGLAVSLVACTGDIRESTTARGSQEMLLLSTAAQRAVAKIDTAVFTGKRVHLDVALLALYDKNYVVDALEQRIVEAGGKRAKGPADAQVVLEVRSAVLGCDDLKYGLGLPLPPIPPGLAPASAPSTIGIEYTRQDGWARLQAWAYEPATGAVVGSWRELWGRAYVGFFDDIMPETTVGETLSTYTK